MDLKTIKRRLRELAADPGQPGARAELQRLRGELRREQHRADVADKAPERRSRSGQSPAPEPEPTEAEKWAAIPGRVGDRIRRSSMSTVITPWLEDRGWGSGHYS